MATSFSLRERLKQVNDQLGHFFTFYGFHTKKPRVEAGLLYAGSFYFPFTALFAPRTYNPWLGYTRTQTLYV
jgi:hypothetical protein